MVVHCALDGTVAVACSVARRGFEGETRRLLNQALRCLARSGPVFALGQPNADTLANLKTAESVAICCYGSCYGFHPVTGRFSAPNPD